MPLDDDTINEIAVVLKRCRGLFATAALFSLAINLLYLAAPLYMMQVYDRVISSASEATLAMLTLMLLGSLATLAGLDAIRAQLLTRVSMRIDRQLSCRVVHAAFEEMPRSPSMGPAPLREFDTFRQFITGNGIHALFDLPWTPIYIAVISLMHPILGLFALGSAALLLGLTVANEYLMRKPLYESNEAAGRNYRFTEMSLRNWQVVQAMGILPSLLQYWKRDRNLALARQQSASERAAIVSALTRFIRLSVQSLILGLGAYLVIEGQASIGVIFAGSLLLSRALQPVEQIVGSWRGLVMARSAYGRVKTLLQASAASLQPAFELPRPSTRLSVEGLAYVVPGTSQPLLQNVSFQIEAGETMCVLGPSGAGKSTLARLLVGILSPSTGAVRLDDAHLDTWSGASLARHIGYLPQEIGLFDATVAQNISRFRQADDREVIAAAKLAGVHETILRLPNGYSTNVGEDGSLLSGGCRQRIALARAVFGLPSLIVLDEPNSNLDDAGELALAQCIAGLKARGTMMLMISHRSSSVRLADKILVLQRGTMAVTGWRDDVVRQLQPASRIRSVTAEMGV